MGSPKVYFSGKRKNRPAITKHHFVSVIKTVSTEKRMFFESLQFVFMDDASLLKINRQFLNHDTYTDIITFDLSENKGIVGEFYISLERVEENAISFGVTYKEEFLRVLFHGALHLLGYMDKTAKDKQAMREAETYCINLYLEKDA
ncbi:MAG: rRNA maturation RNase YbeY [Sphingomonadales bacterium]|nr:rRNA maturation RNase YbeY [Sphingomonadales bacterium]